MTIRRRQHKISLLNAAFLLRSFWQTGWTPLTRLHYAFLTLAAFLFAGWTWYWNLLVSVSEKG